MVRSMPGSASSWRNIVGTMIVDVTSGSASAASAAPDPSCRRMRSVAPRASAPKPNVCGAPLNRRETNRCVPSPGRPSASAQPAMPAQPAANGVVPDPDMTTPFGRPVVPDVYGSLNPQRSSLSGSSVGSPARTRSRHRRGRPRGCRAPSRRRARRPVGNHHPGVGVVEHGADLVGGPAGLQWRVGAAGPPGAEYGIDELGAVADADRDVARRDAAPSDSMP